MEIVYFKQIKGLLKVSSFSLNVCENVLCVLGMFDLFSCKYDDCRYFEISGYYILRSAHNN